LNNLEHFWTDLKAYYAFSVKHYTAGHYFVKKGIMNVACEHFLLSRKLLRDRELCVLHTQTLGDMRLLCR